MPPITTKELQRRDSARWAKNRHHTDVVQIIGLECGNSGSVHPPAGRKSKAEQSGAGVALAGASDQRQLQAFLPKLGRRPGRIDF
jgi:hypothetical protein